MKKNLYYHAVPRRRNVIKEATLNLLFGLTSWPRLLIEVFLRKRFGERYFSMATAVIMTVILFFVPILIAKITGFGNHFGRGSDGFFLIILKNITWYIFLALFMYQCVKRQKEIAREPSVFDFARFSLCTGEIHSKFYGIKVMGKYADHRTISTLLEPGLALAVGILLTAMFQKLGVLLIISSIGYSLSWYGAYRKGDEFVMDTIDEMICNEEMVESFVNDAKSEDTRGFHFTGRRPDNPQFRKQVVESFFEEDKGFADVF